MPGRSIAVSIPGARRMLDAVRVGLLARILGRAKRHDLGHFVLQSPRHSARGLVRSGFPAADLLQEGLDRFSFDDQQVDVLRGVRPPPWR